MELGTSFAFPVGGAAAQAHQHQHQSPHPSNENEEGVCDYNNNLDMNTENNPEEILPQLPPIENNNETPQNQKKRPKPKASPRVVPKTTEHTSESEKLATNQVLLETAARIDNAISELIEYYHTLSDKRKENKPKRQEAIKNIRESLIPMLHIASVSMEQMGMAFAPMGGTRSLHGRNEAQRRKDIVDKKLDKSVGLQMIDDFVKNSVIDMPDHLIQQLSAGQASAANGQAPATAQGSTGKSAIPLEEGTETISILRPLNGTVYTKSEALYVAKMYNKGTRSRGLAIRAMIQQRYCPVTDKTIQRLIQANEKGHSIKDEAWSGPGAPRKHQKDPAAAQKSATAIPPPRDKPTAGDLIEVTLKKQKNGRKRKAEQSPEEVVVKSEKALDGKKKAVSKQRTDAKQSSTKQLSASKPSPKEKAVDANVIGFHLPTPQAGNLYNKSEAVQIAKSYQRGSQQRRWCIEAMCYRGCVPNCNSSARN